jgi:hypothetical protein
LWVGIVSLALPPATSTVVANRLARASSADIR